jgi:membrane protease YdiL (CAAX protease family)
MSHLALAAAVAAVFLLFLWVRGRLAFVRDEMPTPLRLIAALVLLWGVLIACVFYPTVSPGDAVDVDPQVIWFPSLFTGHVILVGFLVAWRYLARPTPLRRFLRLDRATQADIPYGLKVGAVSWLAAIAAGGAVAILLLVIGSGSAGPDDSVAPFDVPPLFIWLIQLPLWRKLIVVGVAMTVEEVFFRAYLQTRLGWFLSSVLFALSHGGYGMPTETASVFAVSLVVGWALRRRDNLLPCIVAHGVFDAVQLLVVMPIAVEHLRALA